MGQHRLVIGLVLGVTACRFNFDPVGLGSGGDDDGSSGIHHDAHLAGTLDAHLACTAAEDTLCASAGGTCDNHVCTIIGTTGDITCPAMTCHVLCGANTCAGGTITCPTSGTCAFYCTGANACTSATFACQTAACDLHCDADASCDMLDVEGAGTSCAIHCCGFTNACNGNTINNCFGNGGACP